jgi:hypothetical protein
MKKTALALIFVLAILFSAVARMQTLKVAKANYYPPPSIEVFSPFPPPVVYSNASVQLYVRVNVLPREPDITFIRYSLDGKSNVTLANLTKEDNVWYWTATEGVLAQGKAFSVEASLGKLADGNHALTVYAHYADGKEMSRSTEFTVDTHYKYPEVVILSPQNKTYAAAEVPLIWACDEQKIVADYTLDLLSHTPLYAYFTLSGNAALLGNTTLTGLSNGTHTLTVYVITERGSASQTVHFTISLETQLQPEPFPTTLAIGSIALVAVVGLGLFVYFKKRSHARTNQHSEIEQPSI